MSYSNPPTFLSPLDMEQCIKASFNQNLNGLNVSGFAMQRIGNKVTYTSVSDTVDQYDYYYLVEHLMRIEITYTDDTKSQLLSVERKALP